MHSIRNIYLNVGTLACSGHIHDFFSKNAALLQSAGIHYPDFSEPLDVPGQRAAYSLINLALASSEALDKYLIPLHELDRQSKSTSHVAETLVLSCPSLFRYANVAACIEGKLMSLFPGASIHYFASFCHQHMEIAALCSINALFLKRSPQELVEIYIRNPSILNYQACIRALQKSLPKGDFHFHLSYEEENGMAQNSLGKSALDAFLAWMRVDLDMLPPELDRSPPSWLFAYMPREWVGLTGLVNRNVSGASKEKSNSPMALPWVSQMPRLMQRPKNLSPLLDEETRQQVHKRYVSSNEVFCKSLGGASFVPPSPVGEQESPWLTRKAARHLVDALDTDFVDTLRQTLLAVERPDACEILFFREACTEAQPAEDADLDAISVDVLTLAYNQENYIEECIKSVLAQQASFSVRHIIVDDVSNDATPDIIARYAKAYPDRIIPIFLQKKRKGDNVRMLFRACNSKYAAMCDGDDYFTDSCKLQKQVDFLEKYPHCSLCFHPVQVLYEDNSPSRVYPSEDLLQGGVRTFYTIKGLFFANIMQTNSVMYRWRFRDGIPGWFDASLVPGDWYWHLLHAEQGLIGYLPHECMSVYRRHPSSLYATAEGYHVDHRAIHGLNELHMYSVVNEHFKGRYYDDICRLAMGVLADFVHIYAQNGDDSLLQKAMRAAPLFARDFLRHIS